MLFIKNNPIIVDIEDILAHVKEQVLLQQGREILRKIKRTGDNIMVCCPNLEHNNGQERKPSCGISLVSKRVGEKIHPAGVYHCFGCGSTGSFSKFVSLCFGFDDEGSFGEKWLLENYVTGTEYERPNLGEVILKDIKRNSIEDLTKILNPQYVSEQELASYRYIHPYMYQRKLTDEIIERYDVGYQKDFRLVTKDANGKEIQHPPVECLTFPVRDINGNCLFVSRRAIHNKNFFLPLDIEKPVYGIYEIPKGAKAVVICESVFNALTCAVYGVPAVALFGTGNEFQYKMLNNLPYRHYILALDPDKAGAKGTWKLKCNLKHKYLTKLIIPTGKDINDLSYEEFMSLQEVLV